MMADPKTIENSALEYFTTYFVQNYPGPTTIISNPRWHAPKVFRAAKWAIQQAEKDHAAAPCQHVLIADIRDDWVLGVECQKCGLKIDGGSPPGPKP